MALEGPSQFQNPVSADELTGDLVNYHRGEVAGYPCLHIISKGLAHSRGLIKSVEGWGEEQ